MSKTLKYVLASPTTIMCNHVCIELTALSWFLQVGQDSMAGKEALVLKGLEAAQINIDKFLSFFPEETIASVKAKVKEENDLNVKEFDPKLGDIINLAPPS